MQSWVIRLTEINAFIRALITIVAALCLNTIPWYWRFGDKIETFVSLAAAFLAVFGFTSLLLTSTRFIFHRRDMLLHSAGAESCSNSPHADVTRNSLKDKFMSYASFAFFIVIAILYAGFYLGMQSVQTGADRVGECGKLSQVILASGVSIPQRMYAPKGPNLSCGNQRYGMFLRIYNAMTIYGVKDRDDQERILRSLTTYKKQTSILPVRVSFFAAEIWIEQSDEKGVLRRGYETPIRVATVGRPFWPVD